VSAAEHEQVDREHHENGHAERRPGGESSVDRSEWHVESH
jgi:hypothetical protein